MADSKGSMMTSIMGQFGPYEKGSDFSGYLERFEYFIIANDIDEKKKKAVFLSFIGESTFALIKDLLQPSKIGDKSFDDIIAALKAHIEPSSSVIVQRYKFDKLMKGPQETVADYINQLRHLSENCQFGVSLEERLRDKLVSGLGDDKMVNRLLSEGDTLTFAKACEICLQMEQNRKDARKLLNGESVNKTSFMKMRTKNEYKFNPQGKVDGEKKSI